MKNTTLATTARTGVALAGALLLLTACSSSDDSIGEAAGENSAAEESAAAEGQEPAVGEPAGDSEMIVTENLPIAGDWVYVDNDAITMNITPEGVTTGTSACNNYSTQINLDPATDNLVVSPAIQTLMACDEEAMDAEVAFLEALQASVKGDVSGDTLTLTTVDGDTLVFTTAQP